MKIMISLQKVMAILVLFCGIILTISESPIEEGLSTQMWLTFGGIALVLLSVGWLWLIDKEEVFWEVK